LKLIFYNAHYKYFLVFGQIIWFTFRTKYSTMCQKHKKYWASYSITGAASLQLSEGFGLSTARLWWGWHIDNYTSQSNNYLQSALRNANIPLYKVLQPNSATTALIDTATINQIRSCILLVNYRIFTTLHSYNHYRWTMQFSNHHR
jgi:hypothetical protein